MSSVLPSRRIGSGVDGAGRVIAIVGAGFSGTMAAIHLRHELPADHTVLLFDKTGRFARGPAYAASAAPHLLNVRSMNMSAFADDPGHFDRWIEQNPGLAVDEIMHTASGNFATRRLYGRYLRSLLHREIVASGGRVRLAADEIVALAPSADGWILFSAAGREILVSGVVLAVGTLPSSRGREGLVFHDPWAAAATSDLSPQAPVLVVGTGLTMVDLVLAMRDRGFSGPIIAISRRGLVPQRHEAAGPPWPAPAFSDAERRSLAALMRRVRAEIHLAAAAGVDWRAVIDGLRPLTSQLWQGLPPGERGRFMRHLRPYWDAHRHRMAPTAADRFEGLCKDGSLRLMRGRVGGISVQGDRAAVAIRCTRSGVAEELLVQRVVYATGLGVADGNGGLVSLLQSAGLARNDPNGIGLEVTDRLEVVGASGMPTPRLWALGPIVRGMFWECTAVPDIRVQARMIGVEVAGNVIGG